MFRLLEPQSAAWPRQSERHRTTSSWSEWGPPKSFHATAPLTRTLSMSKPRLEKMTRITKDMRLSEKIQNDGNVMAIWYYEQRETYDKNIRKQTAAKCSKHVQHQDPAHARSQAGATTKSITLRFWYLPSHTHTHCTQHTRLYLHDAHDTSSYTWCTLKHPSTIISWNSNSNSNIFI